MVLPDGTRHQCHEIVQVQEHQDIIQAYVFPLVHYDLILGMSWLLDNNPSIDWQAGTIQVKSCLIQSKKKQSILSSIPGYFSMSISSQDLVDKIKNKVSNI